MDEEKLTSQYNEAEYQISRLHNIWLECKHFRQRGSLILYRWALDSATIELWNDAKKLDKDDETDYVSKLNDLDGKISKAQDDKNKDELYKKLIEKQKLLKEIQEEAGKGTKYKPAEDDYM